MENISVFCNLLKSKRLGDKLKCPDSFDQIPRYRYCDNIVGMIKTSRRVSKVQKIPSLYWNAAFKNQQRQHLFPRLKINFIHQPDADKMFKWPVDLLHSPAKIFEYLFHANNRVQSFTHHIIFGSGHNLFLKTRTQVFIRGLWFKCLWVELVQYQE